MDIFPLTGDIQDIVSRQRKTKKILMEKYPDRYFVDELNEWNSIKEDKLAWIDRLKEFDAFMSD